MMYFQTLTGRRQSNSFEEAERFVNAVEEKILQS
jgi:hypothetical protein